jgi:HAD superfamily hydrolase (TIGR01509 family)
VQFQALLFDLDGTLVDSHHEICVALECALLDLGVALPFATVRRMVDGSPLEVVWERVLAERAVDAVYEHFAQGYRQHYLRDIGHNTPVFPGVVETLNSLRLALPALKFAVVSNKSAQSVQPLLQRLDIHSHFAFTVGCGGTNIPPKPAPELLLHAARELGCEPARCAMIGDTAFDIEAGKRANMTTIAISHGMASAHELAHAGADHMIHTFAELAPIVLR